MRTDTPMDFPSEDDAPMILFYNQNEITILTYVTRLLQL